MAEDASAGDWVRMPRKGLALRPLATRGLQIATLLSQSDHWPLGFQNFLEDAPDSNSQACLSVEVLPLHLGYVCTCTRAHTHTHPTRKPSSQGDQTECLYICPRSLKSVLAEAVCPSQASNTSGLMTWTNCILSLGRPGLPQWAQSSSPVPLL